MSGNRVVLSALVVVACLSWCAVAHAQVVIETVTVGNPGNPGDTRFPIGDTLSFGGANYVYEIGTFEVTAGQYTEFLNAVAAEDTYELYNEEMSDPSTPYVWGCNIQRSGSPGSYSYSVAPDWADRPVNYVSWGDAARFCNWLHNGQPTAAEDQTTTEDGSYYLNGAVTDGELYAIVREPDATWVIPSEDEWYKAAYHKNDGVTRHYSYYPMGDCYCSNDLVDPDPGCNATFEDLGYTIGSPYYRTEVGEHENSESPYGTFDQGGNVWEWLETKYYGYDGDTGVWSLFRGGCFDRRHTWLTASLRYIWFPLFEDSQYGFRVANVPPCFPSSPPEPDRLALPGDPISRKPRYISFHAGDEGQTQAVRVTFVGLPVPYDTWNGVQLWVQQPYICCEGAGVSCTPYCPTHVGGLPRIDFWAATLQCEPWWGDWTYYGAWPIHTYHEGIVPGAVYDIQVVEEGCDLADESSYSDPYRASTSRWGDVAGDCTTVPCSVPNDIAGIIDVTTVLDKFKNLPGNVIKARVDLEGSAAGDHRVPDRAINITDVTYCLGAFLGDSYPALGFPPPSGPPVCP
jgi:formylglycine-generating enzyme required for sulfatase activity